MKYQLTFVVSDTNTTPYGTDYNCRVVCDQLSDFVSLPAIAVSYSTRVDVDHHVMYAEIFSSMRFIS